MITSDSITASEIGEYVYCKRAWWLQQVSKKENSPAMNKGTADHTALNQAIHIFKKYTYIAWTLLLIGIGFILLFLSYLFAT